MKKINYVGILAIASIAFSASAGNVGAQVDASLEANTSTEVRAGSLRTGAEAESRAEVKAETKAKLDGIRADLKARREAAAALLKTKREELRKEMEANKEEWAAKKEAAAETRAEAKLVAEENRAEAQSEIRARIAANFSKITENLAQIGERINARIEKLKAEGVDVSVSEEFMIKAETSLASAADFAAEVKVKIDSEATVEEIKESANASKAALKEAHQYLRQAVSELKAKITENRVEVKSITDVNVTGEAATQ